MLRRYRHEHQHRQKSGKGQYSGPTTAHVGDLTFVGLVGLMDPPWPEARGAIEVCKAAGIRVKMITGDHRDTAMAIAAELGLGGEAVTGAVLDQMDDAQLAARIETIAVFARVSPEHKIRLVRALKANGEIVAMTGDGVNDAPALKSADIGVAMGSGTEVAKEAATMVLTNDNFATIVGAVREGRTIYDNIVKFVRYQLSTNMGALLTVFVAPLLGLPAPLRPIQILWVAMIMDGPPAVALGLDPPHPRIMNAPPRLFQSFNVFNARSEGRSAFNVHLFANFRLWVALATVVLLQVMVVHWQPLQGLFGTTGLSTGEWGLCVVIASSLLLLEELRKLLSRLRRVSNLLGRVSTSDLAA